MVVYTLALVQPIVNIGNIIKEGVMKWITMWAFW
jgi:hypothetical protein